MTESIGKFSLAQFIGHFPPAILEDAESRMEVGASYLLTPEVENDAEGNVTKVTMHRVPNDYNGPIIRMMKR